MKRVVNIEFLYRSDIFKLFQLKVYGKQVNLSEGCFAKNINVNVFDIFGARAAYKKP